MSRIKKLMVCTDSHFPNHNPAAVDIFLQVVKQEQPDLVVVNGDLLDCNQFQTHAPTWGVDLTAFNADIKLAVDFLDTIQANCGRLAIVEGNHEYRVERMAAVSPAIRGVYDMVAPCIKLMQTAEGKPRKKCTYIPYGPKSSGYPHYKINSRIIAVHGWSWAKNATRQHLIMAQGRSVIHGHTHRADHHMIQDIFVKGRTIHGISGGCLCNPIPNFGLGNPVEWINAFVIGYLGRRSDTLYTVEIHDNYCILPDGREITTTKG